MRVIAGISKGYKLKVRGKQKVRPTLARVKKSIFDTIGEKIIGARVLDLFSGTGNLAIESVARGANYALSVEKELVQFKTILENVQGIGFNDKIKVVKQDAFFAIKYLYLKQEKFDIIIFAPPFLKNLVSPTLLALSENDILKDNGLIIVEHHKKEMPDERYNNLFLFRQKKYGATYVSFFKKITQEDKT